MITDRTEVTQMIRAAKVRKGLTWAGVAKEVGLSKEWTTAACLGQMTFTKPQAEIVGKLFDLPDEAVAWLQVVPYKGSLPTAVPTDPLIYRWYEIVSVYGTTIKELIHEEFGDGIMSAIDFSMDIQREPDPKGDRVNVVLSGKFLPYKSLLIVSSAEVRGVSLRRPQAEQRDPACRSTNSIELVQASCWPRRRRLTVHQQCYARDHRNVDRDPTACRGTDCPRGHLWQPAMKARCSYTVTIVVAFIAGVPGWLVARPSTPGLPASASAAPADAAPTLDGTIRTDE